MSVSPRVSIGLPIYNGERFLAQALDSLLAQTFSDFELIVADNASTDATADICHTYAQLDRRIQYVRNQTNIGVYGNHNKVIKLATADYFKLAAADDLCHPDLLARCVAVLDGDPTVVLTYGRTQFIDENGLSLSVRDPGWHLTSASAPDRLRHVIFSGHWVNTFFGMTRTRALTQTRLFPPYAGSDCALLGELSLKGKFVEIPEYLFFRRLHPEASSQNDDLGWQSVFYTGRHGRLGLPLWHVCLDHARTIVSSELRTRDKMRCLGLVAKRMFDSKRSLLGELHRASWHYARSVAASSQSRSVD